MYELVYYSEANKKLTNEGVADIIKRARNFNSQKDITGCLLYHNREFIQILEGNKEAVNSLFTKIKTDNRHHDIILLHEGEKKERVFSTWSMAYQKLDNSELQKLGRKLFMHQYMSFSKLSEQPTNAVRLFWYMAKHLLER